MTIDWYYVWSPKYEIFHQILYSELIKCPHFHVKPIFRGQEAFSNTYKKSNHFLSGNTVKEEVLLEIMESKAENEYFIFSDVDMIVRDSFKLYELIECSKTHDLVYSLEACDTLFYNVGFGLIKNTKKNMELFKKTIDGINNSDKPDGDWINKFIKEMNIPVSSFPIPEVCQSNMGNHIKKCYIFQILCGNSTYINNMVEKLISLSYYYNLIDYIDLVEPIVWNNLILYFKRREPYSLVASFPMRLASAPQTM